MGRGLTVLLFVVLVFIIIVSLFVGVLTSSGFSSYSVVEEEKFGKLVVEDDEEVSLEILSDTLRDDFAEVKYEVTDSGFPRSAEVVYTFRDKNGFLNKGDESIYLDSVVSKHTLAVKLPESEGNIEGVLNVVTEGIIVSDEFILEKERQGLSGLIRVPSSGSIYN